MLSCTMSYSQLLVDSLGNVGIKAGNTAVKSTLSVNHVGDNTYDIYVYSLKNNGMYIYNSKGNATNSSGLRVFNTANYRGNTNSYGIYAETRNETDNIVGGYVCGVYGKASLGTLNYGVFGNIKSIRI